MDSYPAPGALEATVKVVAVDKGRRWTELDDHLLGLLVEAEGGVTGEVTLIGVELRRRLRAPGEGVRMEGRSSFSSDSSCTTPSRGPAPPSLNPDPGPDSPNEVEATDDTEDADEW